MTKFTYLMRWAALLPGALLAAFAVEFPVHWLIMFLRYLGTAYGNGMGVTDLIAMVPPDVLELFGNAFFTPFMVIAVGARIAPKFKFQTAITLAVLLGFFYGVGATRVADDVSSGLYTPGRWLRLVITVFLQISGVASGLYDAHWAARRRSTPLPRNTGEEDSLTDAIESMKPSDDGDENT